MKRLNGWSLDAAIMLFALASCTNEALLPEAPQVDEPNDPNACQLVGDDFLWDGDETRTSLTIEGNMAKFCWTGGDRVGILPDEGAQVFFTIPEPEEGEEMTNTASFDGGAWALKAESNYAAYYPFVKDFDLDRTEVPVNYKGQKQNGMSTAHLGAYDFQGARPVMTNENGGGVTFDFDHVGALVLLRFVVPVAGTELKSVTLKTDSDLFITEGTYDLTSDKGSGFPITATEKSTTMTVGLDYTTKTNDEEVTVYFMCAPVDLSEEEVNITVSYGDGYEVLSCVVNGQNMKAGSGFLFNIGHKLGKDVIYSNYPAYFMLDNVQNVPVLNNALDNIGQFCTIRIKNNECEISSPLQMETSYVDLDQHSNYSDFIMGFSGFIVGLPNSENVDINQRHVVCYDWACPNCYHNFCVTKRMSLLENGFVYCSACDNNYNLNNFGQSSSGTEEKPLIRYHITYENNSIVIQNPL